MKTSQKRSIARCDWPEPRSSVAEGLVRARRVAPAGAARAAIRSRSPNGQVPVARGARAPGGRSPTLRPRSSITGSSSGTRRSASRLADALEEAQVLGEAAERDVLAVVGRRLAGRPRARGSVCTAPPSVGRASWSDDLVSRVDELERGRQPREAASDDRDLHAQQPRSHDPRASSAARAAASRRRRRSRAPRSGRASHGRGRRRSTTHAELRRVERRRSSAEPLVEVRAGARAPGTPSAPATPGPARPAAMSSSETP